MAEAVTTGSPRSNWVNWEGEEGFLRGRGRPGGLGLCLGSAWPGSPEWKTAAQGEIFLRWCKESVASCVENREAFDSIRISRVGVCLGRVCVCSGWASDDAAPRLVGGFASHSHNTVRCGSVGRLGGRGGRGGEEARSERFLCLLLLLLLLLGVRVLGFGRWVGCDAVRCSAASAKVAQETRSRPAGVAGGSRN